MELPGIHHVTAIAGEPQRNIDFYAGVLGLRLVKRTVNFDDPGSYHLYYGDERGRPGSIVTFFAWPAAAAGRKGTSQIGGISLSVPRKSLHYWADRLASAGVTPGEPVDRLGEKVMPLADPDGLALELVEPQEPDHRPAWRDGPVPVEYAIRGVHRVILWQAALEPSAATLAELLGFRLVFADETCHRYEVGLGGSGTMVDVRKRPEPPGRMGAGTVHHVAWRTPNDTQQIAWRGRIERQGLRVTEVRDRLYFRSIYFREPGGVLFEIATDGPGFTVDEPAEQLGTDLRLPPWLESLRPDLARTLPHVELPAGRQGITHTAR